LNPLGPPRGPWKRGFYINPSRRGPAVPPGVRSGKTRRPGAGYPPEEGQGVSPWGKRSVGPASRGLAVADRVCKALDNPLSGGPKINRQSITISDTIILPFNLMRSLRPPRPHPRRWVPPPLYGAASPQTPPEGLETPGSRRDLPDRPGEPRGGREGPEGPGGLKSRKIGISGQKALKRAFLGPPRGIPGKPLFRGPGRLRGVLREGLM